ncbi:MerR family transcriptional regulator [Massilia sp. UBA6681]|uniref:MerR family transcriptional regulator n=1 Tax=Massilia sp. UBA6681 TaxID=1946839 RepID=UPI0039C9879C
MMTMESTLGVGHAAKLLGLTVKTLQRREREKRLVSAASTASNRRRYTESHLRTVLENKHATSAPDQD